MKLLTSSIFCVLFSYPFTSTATTTLKTSVTSTNFTIKTPNATSESNNNETTTEGSSSPSQWLPEALRDIAYYLRAHKFNEYDRRYETNPELAPREYFRQFPKPPLRSLHWEVHKYCGDSFLECVKYLRRRVRETGSKRIDDTAVVIQEQEWFGNATNHSEQISSVEEECRKMRKQDDLLATPFEGPLERFQWRTTASYFLCWYTMKEEPALKTLGEHCDNFADCLEPTLGANNHDFRANDHIEFACASYSFCPDPCCGVKHESNELNCWDLPGNPCFAENPHGQRQCQLSRAKNVEFRDLVLNRWNVSCACPQKGFEWNSLYGICVDVDECALQLDNIIGKCDADTEVCVNLPGHFRCSCKWGHVRNDHTKKCTPSKALIRFVLNRQTEDDEKTAKNETAWTKFKKLFTKSSTSNHSFSFYLVFTCFVATFNHYYLHD